MDQIAVDQNFLKSAGEWICDAYALDIRYLGFKQDGLLKIIDASLVATPIVNHAPIGFSVEVGSLVAGQEFFKSMPRAELLNRLELAARGKIVVNGLELALVREPSSDHYSEFPRLDSWIFDLHLQVRGARLPAPPPSETLVIDQGLRRAHLPFDGLADLCSWLQLSDSRINARDASINIRVNAPVAIILNESSLDANHLSLILHAHPKFDSTSIELAIREFPGENIKSRKQVGRSIKWGRIKEGLRVGRLNLQLKNAASVLAMLTVGTRTTMRGWVNDPNKAINPRYVATQQFDKDVTQLRLAILETTESRKFEKGIASLLFLIGFAPALHVAEDAPDILVTSPNGKLALVECTLRIADFHKKLGKLVERRNALMKALEASGHSLRVDAFLVCGLPKAQIASEDRVLSRQQVSLLTREDLIAALEQIRIPRNPDEMLDQAAARLTRDSRLFDAAS